MTQTKRDQTEVADKNVSRTQFSREEAGVGTFSVRFSKSNFCFAWVRRDLEVQTWLFILEYDLRKTTEWVQTTVNLSLPYPAFSTDFSTNKTEQRSKEQLFQCQQNVVPRNRSTQSPKENITHQSNYLPSFPFRSPSPFALQLRLLLPKHPLHVLLSKSYAQKLRLRRTSIRC